MKAIEKRVLDFVRKCKRGFDPFPNTVISEIDEEGVQRAMRALISRGILEITADFGLRERKPEQEKVKP